MIEEVERIVKEFKYWPRKTDFIRESVVQKLEKYKAELRERKQAGKTEAIGTTGCNDSDMRTLGVTKREEDCI